VLRPTSDFMFVERAKKYENLIMTDAMNKDSTGETFVITAIGPGMVYNNGQLIAPEVQVGDIVYIFGKILELPSDNGKVLLARAGDCVAYVRDNSGGFIGRIPEPAKSCDPENPPTCERPAPKPGQFGTGSDSSSSTAESADKCAPDSNEAASREADMIRKGLL